MPINLQENFQHILRQLCNRLDLFHSCGNEMKEETIKLEFKNYTPKN